MLMLLGCTDAGQGRPDDDDPPPPEWDSPAEAVDCAPGGDAALFETALADAELDREDVGFTDRQWSAWGELVENPYVLSWFTGAHHEPEEAVCFAGQVQADLDAAAAAAHPVAASIAAAGAHVDIPFSSDPVDAGDTTLPEALERLADVAGSNDDPDRAAEMDADLAAALVPVVLAIADAVELRRELDAVAEDFDDRMPKHLFDRGPGTIIDVGRAIPDITDDTERDWFADWYTGGGGPRLLADAARKVAFAVEDAGLGAFADDDESWSFATDAGGILVSPGSADAHGTAEGALLLHLELGGDDTYTGGAGSTLDESNPVSVLVDLGGDDAYGYDEVPDDNDGTGMLVSDEDGRSSSGGYWVSDSEIGRQGSGRYGIGLLLDLGAGTDVYRSLRMSQGFGAMGVGVLFDDGGDDTYEAEAGAQGAGVFGLGLLLDQGGSDRYLAWAYSQGFAFVGGGGFAVDAGGDDTWRADPGDESGGVTLYYSPQLPNGEGNSSFCQGAGFGMRQDGYSVWLAGGLGVVRDLAGDDTYTSGVFGTGTGYWEGTGIVADGDGNDTYDSLYYTQGGAAHYALAILVDGGGDDRHNTAIDARYMMMGAGHDYSTGILVDESGDDTWVVPGLALGASNCQGVGVFADNDGTDTYVVESTYSTGLGNHSGECEARANMADSVGIFMDSGGDADEYQWPDDKARAPADDTSFGIEWNATDDEHGGAVDGDGETGFHAGY